MTIDLTSLGLQAENTGNVFSDLLRDYGTSWIDQQFAPEGQAMPTSVPSAGGVGTAINTGLQIANKLIPTRPGMPAYQKGSYWDPVKGRWVKRRRRRRPLLTQTDLGIIAQLQAIVGKGDTLKIAVMRACK
jgi:hypothetical protein